MRQTGPVHVAIDGARSTLSEAPAVAFDPPNTVIQFP
jgi:hypothetical protein